MPAMSNRSRRTASRTAVRSASIHQAGSCSRVPSSLSMSSWGARPTATTAPVAGSRSTTLVDCVPQSTPRKTRRISILSSRAGPGWRGVRASACPRGSYAQRCVGNTMGTCRRVSNLAALTHPAYRRRRREPLVANEPGVVVLREGPCILAAGRASDAAGEVVRLHVNPSVQARLTGLVGGVVVRRPLEDDVGVRAHLHFERARLDGPLGEPA